MIVIGFDYEKDINTSNGFRVIKIGPGKYDVTLDARLKGRPEAEQVLRQATDEIHAGVHNGD